jgi:hypothetical protein
MANGARLLRAHETGSEQYEHQRKGRGCVPPISKETR